MFLESKAIECQQQLIYSASHTKIVGIVFKPVTDKRIFL